MEEKKVEYLELIYDLIFVYLIGRSNALLFSTPGGFFSLQSFVTYLISTLIILQVWATSAFYINRYGKNGTWEHVFLFVNMYLLYFMGKGIRTNWGRDFAPYHGAWALITLNLLFQYVRAYFGTREEAERRSIRGQMAVLLSQAVCILLLIFVYETTGMAFSWVPVAIWALGALLTRDADAGSPVNFEHLTERVMLYVVFTYGEMTVSIVDYFEGEVNLESVYYSLLAFLIIAGLFLSYGFLYNHVIDRGKRTTGKLYLFLHIGLIICLNNLTVALEFMRRAWLDSTMKNILLFSSFVGYYAFLLGIGWYSRREQEEGEGFLFKAILIAVLFVLLSYERNTVAWASILLSAAYVYGMLGMIMARYYRKKEEEKEGRLSR